MACNILYRYEQYNDEDSLFFLSVRGIGLVGRLLLSMREQCQQVILGTGGGWFQ